MAPRTSEQFKEIRKKSRAKILYASLELFAIDGYHAVSVSKIAKHAGVSKGLIYNYFESKEELLKALIEMYMAEGEAMMGGILDPDPKKMMANIIKATFSELKERPEIWKLLMALSLKVGQFPFIQDIIEQKVSGYLQMGTALLSQLGFENPEMEARLLGALFDGIAVQYITVSSQVNLDELEIFMVEKYCNHEKA